MSSDSPLINIITYQLPFDLANQIYNEFQSRNKEASFLVETYKKYSPLKNDYEVVEIILALSIFHKRVIASLNGAVKFYNTVSTKSTASTIKIGAYNLTGEEKNKILAVVITYRQLLEKFSIPEQIMEYYHTRELLIKIINLKEELKNADKKPKRNIQDDIEDNFPF